MEQFLFLCGIGICIFLFFAGMALWVWAENRPWNKEGKDNKRQ